MQAAALVRSVEGVDQRWSKCYVVSLGDLALVEKMTAYASCGLGAAKISSAVQPTISKRKGNPRGSGVPRSSEIEY